MTRDEFLATKPGTNVLAHVGNAEHVAKIVGKDHGRETFDLLFVLADGTPRLERRHRAKCQRVTQGVSVGRLNKPISENAVASLLWDRWRKELKNQEQANV
jgi:hypothetical protein